MFKPLKEMNLPNDIKNMSERDLELTGIAIREFLIDSLSRTGGHLASNLGVVELTLAMHKVFDFNKDKVIWDVGHQSYVHKILTGRIENFDRLRKTNGMSGFPKLRESKYDFYETGHSSTSISVASGFATARDIRGDKYDVVAVIGDGSMTGGPALEALNNLAQASSKVIVILNDNGMSISNNIGGLSEHLGVLRASKGYQNSKTYFKRFIDKIPVVGKGMHTAMANAKEWIKYAFLPSGIIFEELGITYLGPINGHSIKDMISVIEQARQIKGPVLIHAITQKGKGYIPAERNPNAFHGVGQFDKETGIAKKKKAASYSDVFGQAMLNIAQEDENIIGITAAMCDSTGLAPMREKYPNRVFDVGIAEAHGVLFAAGAAANGLKPVVAIYSTFLQRAYDEIIEDVCLMSLPVIFAIDRAGIVGEDGETHHGVFDISYMMSIPNMTILAPCDGVQLTEALSYAKSLNSPVAIRYPRGEAIIKSLANEEFRGQNIRVKSGDDIDIFAVGTMLNKALVAAEELSKRGISAGVVNIVSIKPFDETILKDANKRIIVVEDNLEIGGLGEYLKAKYNEFDISIAAWPDGFIEHGSCDDLYADEKLDSKGIVERIRKIIEETA